MGSEQKYQVQDFASWIYSIFYAYCLNYIERWGRNLDYPIKTAFCIWKWAIAGYATAIVLQKKLLMKQLFLYLNRRLSFKLLFEIAGYLSENSRKQRKCFNELRELQKRWFDDKTRGWRLQKVAQEVLFLHLKYSRRQKFTLIVILTTRKKIMLWWFK